MNKYGVTLWYPSGTGFALGIFSPLLQGRYSGTFGSAGPVRTRFYLDFVGKVYESMAMRWLSWRRIAL
jgi:hypothetical protein